MKNSTLETLIKLHELENQERKDLLKHCRKLPDFDGVSLQEDFYLLFSYLDIIFFFFLKSKGINVSIFFVDD